MQQPERDSAVAGVDVFHDSKIRFGERTAWATSVLLQSCWVWGRWPVDFCNAVVADARAQGKIIQPRNHPDLISQRSGVKRKQCVEAAHAIREVKAAKVFYVT